MTMNKTQSRKILPRLLLALVIAGLVCGLVLVAMPNLTYAMRSIYQVGLLFARVEREIMMPTNYGNYYRDLFYKHTEELTRIYAADPELRGDMYMLMNLYTPHIEAVLDGRGDEVSITKDQVEQLETFFLAIAAVSNEALRLDIERELGRTPLEDFIGLNMDETLLYIESTYQRDFPE
jgi:hypothetical protein